MSGLASWLGAVAKDFSHPTGWPREPSPLPRGLRVERLVFGFAYLAAAFTCMFVLPKGHGFSVTAPVAVILAVVSERVSLQQRETVVTCSQAALVLLVFAIPLNLAPFAILFCTAVGMPLQGRRSLSQFLMGAANSWWGFGAPVLLALLAPGPASWSHWLAYVAAFGGQALIHDALFAVRFRIADLHVGPSEWVASLSTEACLTPVGLTAATELHSRPAAALALMLGVIGLFALSGRESRERWAQTERALRDPLTGLANRALFDEAVSACEARCQRKNEDAALLLVDLDNFKDINDALGHPAGDEVLCAFADGLRTAVRAGDLAARMGGDEFAVSLAEPMDLDRARRVTKALREHFAEPITLSSGQEVRVGFSVGAALFGSQTSAPDAMVEADTALYSDKRARKEPQSEALLA